MSKNEMLKPEAGNELAFRVSKWFHKINVTPAQKEASRLFISYLIGFIASLVLVFVSFFLATHPTTRTETMSFFVLGTILILQVIVQVVFFFRLSTKTAHDRWNFWVFMFTLLIMLIVVSGSLWIMYNLNYYMVN